MQWMARMCYVKYLIPNHLALCDAEIHVTQCLPVHDYQHVFTSCVLLYRMPTWTLCLALSWLHTDIQSINDVLINVSYE